jgi:hypothetical protein
MKQQEVAVLLALANGHDQRHGLDDVKVQAWHSLFQQACPDLDPKFAAEKINEHYARTTDMLMPAHIVTAWKARKQYLRDRRAIPSGRGTPMPDYVREELARITARKAVGD